MLEIFITIIGVGILLIVWIGWFSSKTIKTVVETAVNGAKPNITISINQPQEKVGSENLPELLQTLLTASIIKEVQNIEQPAELQKPKAKDDTLQ